MPAISMKTKTCTCSWRRVTTLDCSIDGGGPGESRRSLRFVTSCRRRARGLGGPCLACLVRGGTLVAAASAFGFLGFTCHLLLYLRQFLWVDASTHEFTCHLSVSAPLSIPLEKSGPMRILLHRRRSLHHIAPARALLIRVDGAIRVGELEHER